MGDNGRSEAEQQGQVQVQISNGLGGKQEAGGRLGGNALLWVRTDCEVPPCLASAPHPLLCRGVLYPPQPTGGAQNTLAQTPQEDDQPAACGQPCHRPDVPDGCSDSPRLFGGARTVAGPDGTWPESSHLWLPCRKHF